MLESLITDAKRIHEITGRPMDECKEQATNIALCVSAMKCRIVEMYFVKKDGTMRQAFGTLQEDIIRPHIKDATNREPNPDIVTYFDTVKQQFRSFRKENFKSFKA